MTPPPPSYDELILTFNNKSRPSLSEFEEPPPGYETVVDVDESVNEKCLDEEIFIIYNR